MEKEELIKKIEELRNELSTKREMGYSEDYINIFYKIEIRKLKQLLKEI